MVLLQIVVQPAPEQKTAGAPGTLAAVTTNEHWCSPPGGLAGIAWETGILRGIADTSPVR
jgi:hypothetical protein